MAHTHEAAIRDINDVYTFALAGNATLTLENTASGARYTYKLQAPYVDRNVNMERASDKIIFVKLLTGPDNESSYSYMGSIVLQPTKYMQANPYKVQRSAKSAVGEDAPSFKAINWVLALAKEKRSLPAGVNVYHSGQCGRCGRKLTVPESIERGIGPDCAGQMGLL